MKESEQIEHCPDCKTGVMQRDHMCEDYIVWLCSEDNCQGREMEHLSDMDDASWAWLRKHYKDGEDGGY